MAEVFRKNVVIGLEIETVTGLHIGGSDAGLKIGGSDNPVITTEAEYEGKNIPVPYIPGSSLKGKMRSLLLTVYGVRNGDKMKFAPGREDLDKMFGRPADSDGRPDEINRTRIIVRDAIPTSESVKNAMEASGTFFEVKGENQIDPVTGKANPRFMDRVVPGIKFSGEIVLQVFEGDDEKRFLNYVQEGLNLIQDSYLGGQGSRGYGKVKIKTTSISERGREDYLKIGSDLLPKV